MKRRGVVLGVLVGVAVLVALWSWRGRTRVDDDVPAGTRAGDRDTSKRAGRDGSGVKKIDDKAGRRIAGRVIGDDGGPIANAKVTLSTKRTRPGAPNAPTVTTDAAGAFDFGPRSTETYVVAAARKGLTPTALRLDSRDAVPATDQLRIVLHACDASLHGVIRDSAGGVVAGAQLALDKNGMRSGASVESDREGTYEMCVPSGGVGIEIVADGYATLSDRANVTGRTRRDYQLVPGTTVTGRVVRSADKSPVGDAAVRLVTNIRGSDALTAWSEADGTFTVDGVASGQYNASAVADGLAMEQPLPIAVELEGTNEITLELITAAKVSGRVIEVGTGKPVATNVAVRPNADRYDRMQFIATRDDGSFVVDHVMPGDYLVVLFSYDGATKEIHVDKTDVTDLVFEVEARGSIAGVVRYGGKPVDGAELRVQGARITADADADGRFELRGVPAGTHRIYAESSRVGAFTDRAVVTLTEAEHRKNVVIDLDLAASIAGKLVDQNDVPVAGAFVRFESNGDQGVATTADDGTFVASAMKGGGDYAYEVRDREGSSTIYPPVSGKRFPPIAVADGKTHITGVTIKARVDRLVISGRVTDAAGAAIPDATVVARGDGARGFRTPSASSDQNGAFALRDLSAGKYTLDVVSTRGVAREEKVAAGQTGVVLRLQALGSIDGTLEGFTERVEVSVWPTNGGGRSRPLVTMSGTTFRAVNLPPGDYRVSAVGKTSDGAADVSVAPGTPSKVTVRPRAMGTIEGTLTGGASKKPGANMYCAAMGGRIPDSGIPSTTTDENGAFRIERVSAGPSTVRCTVAGTTVATAQVVVVAGQSVRVSLVAEDLEAKEWTAGMSYARQLEDIVVTVVATGGPAERAGVRVGDIITKLNDAALRGRSWTLDNILMEWEPASGPVKLELERSDKPLTVSFVLEQVKASSR